MMRECTAGRLVDEGAQRRAGRPDATRAVGDAWLNAGEAVLLRVPSVVLPESANYVINAAHPEASALHVQAIAPLLLDNRVLARIGAS